MKIFTLSLVLILLSFLTSAQQTSFIPELDKISTDVQKIDYLIKQAYNSWDKKDTNTAIVYARKSVQLAEEKQTSLCEAYLVMGDILYKHSEYNEALRFLEESKGLAMQLKDKTLQTKALLIIARIYLLEGKNLAIALEYSKQAVLLSKALSDKLLLVESLFLMGDSYKFEGDYKNALECHLQILKLKEEGGDLGQIADAYHSIGWTYISIADFDKALEYFKKNVSFRTKTGDKQGLGEALHAVGRCYQGKLEFSTALEYYFQALAVFQSDDFNVKSQSRDFWIASLRNDVGWCYNLWNKPEKALPYLLSSMEMKEKDGNQQMLAYIYHTLGETYLSLKQYDKSEIYLTRALKLTEVLGLRKDKMIVYDNLSKLESAKQNFKSALLYKEKNNVLKDSLFTEEKNKQLAYLESTFEMGKKEAENKLLLEQLSLQKATVEKQAWIVVSIAGALLSFMGMSFFLYRSNLNKKNVNRILQEQKEEIVSQNEEIASQNNEISNKNEELRQVIEELSQVNEYLDKLVSQRTSLLEKQNQQLREYAFINAHKLRAPLASILGLVNIIKMTTHEKIDKTLIDHLRFSTEKLDMVIHEIQQTLEEVKVPEVVTISRKDNSDDSESDK
jgi:tetratricopeptide (TPR) repeat protein